MDGNFPMLIMEELVCSLSDFIMNPEKYAAADKVFEPLQETRRSNDTSKTKSLEYTPHKVSELAAEQEMPCIASASCIYQSKSPEKAEKSKPVVQNTIKHIHKVTIALNIAQGLHYLHTKKLYPIVHRDLSSGNILLRSVSDKFIAKIADFGQSKEKRHKKDWSSINPGTLYYLPPEVLVLDSAEPGKMLATIHEEPQEAERQQVPPAADQIPEALEPDDIRTATQPSHLRPTLKTSLDMYMYGVLIIELVSQQGPHKWKEKENWLMTHKCQMESLNNKSILYQVAKKCISEHPDDRICANEVVKMIRSDSSTFPRSPSGGSFNEVS